MDRRCYQETRAQGMARGCPGAVWKLERQRFSGRETAPKGLRRRYPTRKILMYALDSNTVIFALKGKGNVRQRLTASELKELSVPAIVVYELEFGTIGSLSPAQRRRDLKLLLSTMDILPFDRRSAEQAARIRYQLEKAGTRIGPLDTLIAGTALAHGAVLVTNNIRELARVPGLQVEDWL